jgi:uncharacterized protein (UPF0276 family)
MPMPDPTQRLAGIGWRHAHERDLLEARPPLPFIEVHSENFFADGGAPLALLAAAREHYPVSLHGVGLASIRCGCPTMPRSHACQGKVVPRRSTPATCCRSPSRAPAST